MKTRLLSFLSLSALVCLAALVLGAVTHAAAEDTSFAPVFDALDKNEFKAAADLADKREKEFRKSGDAALVKAAEYVQKHIKDLDREYQAVQVKLKTAARPDENLEVGRFECFTKRNWDAGLALLAECQNPALQQLAKSDLENPSTTKDQHALAEKWARAAEKPGTPGTPGTPGAPGAPADAMNQRAEYWELKALHGLEPRERAAAEAWLWQRFSKRIHPDGRVDVDVIQIIRALPDDQLSRALNLQFSGLALGSDWGPGTNRAGTYLRVYGSVNNGSSTGQIKDSIRCGVRALCINGDEKRVVVDFAGSVRIAEHGTQGWSTDSSSDAYVRRLRYHNANEWLPHAVHVQITYEKTTIYEAFLQAPASKWGVWWVDDSLIGSRVR